MAALSTDAIVVATRLATWAQLATNWSGRTDFGEAKCATASRPVRNYAEGCPIFNQRGYEWAAFGHVMRVTGLQKGGI
jgi:hypothetical protein